MEPGLSMPIMRGRVSVLMNGLTFLLAKTGVRKWGKKEEMEIEMDEEKKR